MHENNGMPKNESGTQQIAFDGGTSLVDDSKNGDQQSDPPNSQVTLQQVTQEGVIDPSDALGEATQDEEEEHDKSGGDKRLGQTKETKQRVETEQTYLFKPPTKEEIESQSEKVWESKKKQGERFAEDKGTKGNKHPTLDESIPSLDIGQFPDAEVDPDETTGFDSDAKGDRYVEKPESTRKVVVPRDEEITENKAHTVKGDENRMQMRTNEKESPVERAQRIRAKNESIMIALDEDENTTQRKKEKGRENVKDKAEMARKNRIINLEGREDMFTAQFDPFSIVGQTIESMYNEPDDKFESKRGKLFMKFLFYISMITIYVGAAVFVAMIVIALLQ